MQPAFLSSRYYLKFGLDRDPFPQKYSSQSKLFLTHELTGLMDTLVSAIATQEEILVVESLPGGGKTSLAGYLYYLKKANWYPCLISATETLDRTELAHAIISQHFPRHRFDKTKSSVILQEFLQLYQRNGKLPVVIVDNAHLLPRDTLKFILEIASLRYEGGQFRMVLFADTSIVKQLAHQSLRSISSATCEHKRIPSFSRAQTTKYLEYRLSPAGTCRPDPFDNDAIEQIFNQSAGIPGEINKLARQQMKGFVIPGRLRDIFIRTTASIAAGLIIFVTVYAGMTTGDKDTEAGAPVFISLKLPDNGVEVAVVEDSKIPRVQQKKNRVVSRDKNVKKTAKPVARKTPKQNNRTVLLADMNRQTKVRARKVADKRAKQELRMQLAVYDTLALRVSDVVQN